MQNVPKGMSLYSSNATSDEGKKFTGTLWHNNTGKNPMLCRINATCNTYTMTNNFNSDETCASLERLQKKYAALEAEHQRVARKYQQTKMLLCVFNTIFDIEGTESEKLARMHTLHSKTRHLFTKRPRDQTSTEENDAKKARKATSISG